MLFGYNRPDHMRQTLDYLAQADGAVKSPLWIFCDGPKPGTDPAQVEAVRALAHDPQWVRKFASVKVAAAAHNKGLARSIISGVSAVMDEAGRAIVVEDDVLVAPDFLRFMNDCLEFYKDDQSVGSITGFSPLTEAPSGYTHDIMALPRNCSHGWATWANRWQQVDWEARDATKLARAPALRRRFNAAGNDRFGRLQRQLAGKIDSWSIRFGLWQTLAHRHTIYPVDNRVQNIGYDGSGVHTKSGQNVNTAALSEPRSYRLELIEQNPAVIREVSRIYSGSWLRRTARSVRSWVKGKNA